VQPDIDLQLNKPEILLEVDRACAADLGWVIVGGMAFGTLLTVFVVPTVYTLFARRRVPGANLAPEHADAAPAPESPEAPPLAKAGAD
jgi:hypothetical protein